MATTTDTSHTSPSVVDDPAFRTTAAGFLLGLATILAAWGSQLIGGLVPCELCLEQRMAYYVGLPIVAIVLLGWKHLPRPVWMIGMALGIATFVWSMWMSGYHAGVEWGFWPGPTACTGLGTSVSFEDLNNINSARVIPCDVVQFRLLGISLAGYNFLISVAIVGLLGWSLAKGRQA